MPVNDNASNRTVDTETDARNIVRSASMFGLEASAEAFERRAQYYDKLAAEPTMAKHKTQWEGNARSYRRAAEIARQEVAK
jgi:hypothetical protein